MCIGSDHGHGTASGHDEWLVDDERLRAFVGRVRAAMAAEPDRARLTDALRPDFAALLAADGWLPDAFAQPYAASGMGGGIGQYLLYRAGDGGLSLFALVVPGGSATPVHDHLAWGLIGLYRGEQAEDVYRRADDGGDPARADLRLVERRPVRSGEFCVLLPPEGDIHRVATTSAEPSISIHLLGNDTGCVWRHAYEPETGEVRPFRSGYANRPCDGDGGVPSA